MENRVVEGEGSDTEQGIKIKKENVMKRGTEKRGEKVRGIGKCLV